MIHTYKSKQDENEKRKNGSSRASNGSKHGSGGEEDGEGGEGEGEQVAKVAPGFRIPLFFQIICFKNVTENYNR